MRAKGKKPASSSTPTRAANSITDRVDALAEVLRRHDLSEVEVEEGGVRIYVRRGGGALGVGGAAGVCTGCASGAGACVVWKTGSPPPPRRT